MSIFYLDIEGGNDGNDGTSFANRWKTFTSGATAARIAPGDTIRVMGSTNPTSLGINGTWTNGPLPAIQSITSSTNATPIVVTKASHGLANGDTIVIVSHATNTNANGTWEVANITSSTFELAGSTGNGVGGASGSFRNINNCRVKLASALTANIASFANRGEGRVAWTQSANVTATLSTADMKCSDVSDSIAVAAGFTTGLAAYFATGTLDLSTYQGVSFWIKQTAGTVAVANDIQFDLCTDTAGVTSVHTVPIPALVALNSWYPVYWDNASNLNASIKSIGFTVNVDHGAQTFLISNINAVKAAGNDNLNIVSLIGKNSAGETFWGLQSINGTRVILDGSTNTTPISANMRGYFGTTETVTAYKRECIHSLTSANNAIQDSGTSGNLITFSGGWDRTNMSTQTLETWFCGAGATTNGISASSKNFISLDKISAVRYTFGYTNSGGTDVSIDNSTMSNCSNAGFIFGDTVTFGTVYANCNLSAGMNLLNTSSGGSATSITVLSNSGSAGANAITDGDSGRIWTTVNCSNNGAGGIELLANDKISSLTCSGNLTFGASTVRGSDVYIDSLTAANNSTFGLVLGSTSVSPTGNTYIRSGSLSGNTSGDVQLNYGLAYMRRVTMSSGSEVVVGSAGAFTGARVYSEHHDNTTDNHKIWDEGGTIVYSGGVWQFSPTSTSVVSSIRPLSMVVGRFAVRANSLVTVTSSMKRDNAGLTGKLICPAKMLNGISNIVSSSISGTGSYESVIITFTPTESGVVEIQAQCYGGTTFNMFVQNCTASQA